MFSIQFLLFVLFSSLFAGIFLYFFRKNKELELEHTQYIHSINQSILLHKTQLNYRDKGLLQYNFLKYNLNESLKVQPEINLI